MKKTNQIALSAAVAGILSAGVALHSVSAFAEDAVTTAAQKGHCMGANSCGGKSACATAKNDCAGKNGCKGKGFLEKTKAECDAMAKKDKKIKFEAAKM